MALSSPSALFSLDENSPVLRRQPAAALHPSIATIRAAQCQAYIDHLHRKAMAVRLEEAGTVRHRLGAVLRQEGMVADLGLEKTHTGRDRGLDRGRQGREV